MWRLLVGVILAAGCGGGSTTDLGAGGHCSDGVKDGDETDLDCGGLDCPKCGDDALQYK
jgi:hypothetical protein